MKILAIYPGLNPTFDEVAFALPPLIEHGCKVRVITTRTSKLKTDDEGSRFENFHGVEIFRIFSNADELENNPAALRAEVMRLADEFEPELLFLNSFRSLPVSRMIRRRNPVPALLRVESADPLTLLRRRYYLGWKALGRLVGRANWWHVAADVDAFMINDPTEIAELPRIGVRGRPAYYAGHCTQAPADINLATQRDRAEMLYIGSLIRHKNCAVWLKTVPEIFDSTPVERFTVIGRGPFQYVVNTLRKKFGDRIQYIPSVNRREALERLSTAFFAYTESNSGWGFLCDAWLTRTPVLCPRSTFAIVPDVTGMMPRSNLQLVEAVCRLYSDAAYYHGLQEGGTLRYLTQHTAEVVSRQYLQIFERVMSARRVA